MYCQGKNIFLLRIIQVSCPPFQSNFSNILSFLIEMSLTFKIQGEGNISLLFLKIWTGWLWTHTGKPTGEYESAALFRKHCRWMAEGNWRAVAHAFFLVMHIIPSQSWEAFPWLFTLRWPMLSSGGFGRKRTITAFLSLL